MKFGVDPIEKSLLLYYIAGAGRLKLYVADARESVSKRLLVMVYGLGELDSDYYVHEGAGFARKAIWPASAVLVDEYADVSGGEDRTVSRARLVDAVVKI